MNLTQHLNCLSLALNRIKNWKGHTQPHLTCKAKTLAMSQLILRFLRCFAYIHHPLIKFVSFGQVACCIIIASSQFLNFHFSPSSAFSHLLFDCDYYSFQSSFFLSYPTSNLLARLSSKIYLQACIGS